MATEISARQRRQAMALGCLGRLAAFVALGMLATLAVRLDAGEPVPAFA